VGGEVSVVHPEPVTRVEPLGPAGVVYNVEVLEHNNYFAGGILVHNCVDDPSKINEVASDSLNDYVLEWWDTVMGTRGNDPRTARRVIVMQRLRENDLTGHVLSQKLGYEALVLPARYEPDRVVYSYPEGATSDNIRALSPPDAIVPTVLQRKRPELRDPRRLANELLWPEQFGEAELKQLERTLGPWGSASQLQQRPVPAGGGILKQEHFQYFEEHLSVQDGFPVKYFTLRQRSGTTRNVLAKDCRVFQTVDTAMRVGQGNDYFVVGTFAVTPLNDLLVLRMFRARIEVPFQMAALIRERELFPNLLYQAIEDKQSGTGLIQTGRLKGIPFRTLKADGDKVARGACVATMYENYMVYHLAGADWLLAFEEELLKVPNGRHDDQYDTLAYAGILVTTDAMLANTQTVDDLFVYPSRADREEKAKRAGMDDDRYGLLFEDWDDEFRR
jgi:predicted phage terminase large subunit-like protein